MTNQHPTLFSSFFQDEPHTWGELIFQKNFPFHRLVHESWADFRDPNGVPIEVKQCLKRGYVGRFQIETTHHDILSDANGLYYLMVILCHGGPGRQKYYVFKSRFATPAEIEKHWRVYDNDRATVKWRDIF